MPSSERLPLILRLKEQLGISGLAEVETHLVRHRPVPPRLLRALAEAEYHPLSKREREIMVLIASGFTKQEVGDELGITLGTVKSHLRYIHRKLNVHNRVQAINAFLEWEA